MSEPRQYPTDRRAFLELVGVLRVRQATEQGYIECEPGGVFDAAYPPRYDERTRSRLLGHCRKVFFIGEDMRLK